jgi:hypothetical protein
VSLKDSGFATNAVMEMLPSFENLTALPTTLRRVCMRRFSSPIAYTGKSDAKCKVSDSFLTHAIGLIKLRTCN